MDMRRALALLTGLIVLVGIARPSSARAESSEKQALSQLKTAAGPIAIPEQPSIRPTLISGQSGSASQSSSGRCPAFAVSDVFRISKSPMCVSVGNGDGAGLMSMQAAAQRINACLADLYGQPDRTYEVFAYASRDMRRFVIWVTGKVPDCDTVLSDLQYSIKKRGGRLLDFPTTVEDHSQVAVSPTEGDGAALTRVQFLQPGNLLSIKPWPGPSSSTRNDSSTNYTSAGHCSEAELHREGHLSCHEYSTSLFGPVGTRFYCYCP